MKNKFSFLIIAANIISVLLFIAIMASGKYCMLILPTLINLLTFYYAYKTTKVNDYEE
jgi:hypothetical protein